MIQLDVHTHSGASGHGSFDTIQKMAQKASDMGLSLLGITDHGPATPGSCTPSYFRSLTLAPRNRFGINLLYGVELNILDEKGTVDLPQDILKRLDFAAAGLHTKTKSPGSITENTDCYIKAMENSYVKLICHCDDTSFPADMKELVLAARANHVLLEISNVSLAPWGYRGNTVPNSTALLKYCMEYGQPILLSSDSHGAEHIGDVTYAERLVQEQGFPQELILNYDVHAFLAYIQEAGAKR